MKLNSFRSRNTAQAPLVVERNRRNSSDSTLQSAWQQSTATMKWCYSGAGPTSRRCKNVFLPVEPDKMCFMIDQESTDAACTREYCRCSITSVSQCEEHSFTVSAAKRFRCSDCSAPQFTVVHSRPSQVRSGAALCGILTPMRRT